MGGLYSLARQVVFSRGDSAGKGLLCFCTSHRSAEFSQVPRSDGFAAEARLRESSVPCVVRGSLLLGKGVFHVLGCGCISFLQMVGKARLAESGSVLRVKALNQNTGEQKEQLERGVFYNTCLNYGGEQPKLGGVL